MWMNWSFRKQQGTYSEVLLKEKMDMKETERAILEAKKAGFDQAVPLGGSTVEPLQEVRQMCASNTCQKDGKNWSCPPACGSLKECREEILERSEGILVQTVGTLEDSLDVESMMETERLHKEHFRSLHETLREQYEGLLALGAGCCTICQACTYPSSACRFTEKRISSLEAYGILVSDLCTRNQLKYYYGENTIAYTSCFLWKRRKTV